MMTTTTRRAWIRCDCGPHTRFPALARTKLAAPWRQDGSGEARNQRTQLVGENAKLRETCRPHRKVEGLCQPCAMLGGDGGESFAQVAGGHGFAAALSSSGHLWMWGKGLGVRPAPVTAAMAGIGSCRLPCVMPALAEIAAGGSAVVARAADGRVFTFAGGTPMVELPTSVRGRCLFKKKGQHELVGAGQLLGWAEPSSLVERCVAAVSAALARGDALVCVQMLQLVGSQMDVPALSATTPACVACAMAHRTRVAQVAVSAGVDLDEALLAMRIGCNAK